MIKLVRPHSRLFQPVRFVHSVRPLKCNSSSKDRSFASSNEPSRKKKLSIRVNNEDQYDQNQMFPFSKLTDDHFRKLNREIKNPFPLALVAGHRPLYIMDPNMDKNIDLDPEMGVAEVKGMNPLESQEVEIPISIMSKLGPFDPVSFAENGKLSEIPVSRRAPEDPFEGIDPQTLVPIRKFIRSALGDGDDVLVARIARPWAQLSRGEMDFNLKDFINLLDESAKNDGVQVVVREDDNVAFTPRTLQERLIHRKQQKSLAAEEAGRQNLENSIMRADSVKRKRRLKMNRHKYKKRRKEQQALRKKLGKT
jgi:hypothetical protein